MNKRVISSLPRQRLKKKIKFLYLQLGVHLGSEERDVKFLGAKEKIGNYSSGNGELSFLLSEYIRRISLIDSLDLNG